MGANSKISWTDHTHNPWIGCTRKSRGCQECYAEDLMADRYARVTWGPKGERSRTKTGRDPIAWDKAAGALGIRQRVFCASLADVFDDHPSILPEWRSDLWDLIAKTPNLDWLLLTKRPENWAFMLPVAEPRPPFDHVRLGVTIEDQDAADERGMILQFAVDIGWPTFISYEPALSSVNWTPFIKGGAIDWLICGAESGPNRRPFDEDYARQSRDAAKQAGGAFFYKQKIDERGRKVELPELDGRQWAEFPAPPEQESADVARPHPDDLADDHIPF